MFGASTQPPAPQPSLFSFGQNTTASKPKPQLSLFGTTNTQSQPQQQQQIGSGSLFGSTTQPAQQSTGLFGNTQPAQQQPQSGGLFGNTQSAQQGTSLFGNTQPQQSSGLFGNNQPQQQQSGGLFGNAQSQQQQSSSLFGNTQQPQQSGHLFANTQPQSNNIFGASAQTAPQSTSIFGASNQPLQQPQQGQSLFGGNAFGQSQQQQTQQNQRPLDQTLRFGQSQQNQSQIQNAAQPLWEEGRGMGVHRPIPAQMNIVKDKWDPASLSSPLRTYVYQHVNSENEALLYRPGPGEDENKWEEAVSNRPGPAWVPLLVRGFWELGKKAQIQMEAIQRCNMMLQEINTSLDLQLDTHRQKVTNSLMESRKRSLAMSQRCLALAVKVQILRNRGYVMDNAEEELKAKLEKLERDILDPSLGAREQELWARMLGIRERAKRLKSEMDKSAPTTKPDEPVLDEATMKAAKQTLEAYDVQLRHLHKELELVQQEYTDWERLSSGSGREQPSARKR